MIKMNLTATLAALVVATATLAAAAGPPHPAQWAEADWRTSTARYTVQVATFPSADLARSIARGLENLEWSPVFLASDELAATVCLGDFTTLAEAEFVARELAARRVADARAVPFPVGVRSPGGQVQGPFLPAFLPTPGQAPKAPSESQVLTDLRAIAMTMASEAGTNLETLVGRFEAAERAEEKGPAAAAIVAILNQARTAPEVALYLAGPVARGEWPAPKPARLACGEVVADLLYGHRRDWRGAYSATRALLDDEDRTPEGRLRDLLRLAALEVDLASSGSGLRPSFQDIRARLRQAWDEPAEAPRTRAKLELVFLQTFAWEGRWDRVDGIAREYIRRNAQFLPETGLARIYRARSLERTRDYAEAINQLSIVINQVRDPADGLFMGFERRNLRGEANRWRRHFERLAATEDMGLPEVPADAPRP